MYSVDVLLPTARFAFWVDGGRVEVVPEHRSPEGYVVYEELAAERQVVGMTTFPNTVLLRGPKTILVDPGIHLQNQPVIKALAAHGLGVDDLDFIALTHAHLDHAGACADVPGPVVVHELELDDPDRPMVAGLLPRERLRLLSGDEGELDAGHHLGAHAGPHRRRRVLQGRDRATVSSCSPATPSARCATTTNGSRPASARVPTPSLPHRGGRSRRGARRCSFPGTCRPFPRARSRRGALEPTAARPCARLKRRAQTKPRSRTLPIYEYRCDVCGHTLEVFQKFADEPLETCEVCGGHVSKVLHPVAIHFKGSGFYTTDYGRGSKKARAASDAKPADESKTADEAQGQPRRRATATAPRRAKRRGRRRAAAARRSTTDKTG